MSNSVVFCFSSLSGGNGFEKVLGGRELKPNVNFMQLQIKASLHGAARIVREIYVVRL